MSTEADRTIHRANQLKLAKQWAEAGDAFCTAAQQCGRRSHRFQELFPRYLADAANCYKKLDPRFAILALQAAAPASAEQGQFSMAAELHQELAELAHRLWLAEPVSADWMTVGGGFGADGQKRVRLLQETAHREEPQSWRAALSNGWSTTWSWLGTIGQITKSQASSGSQGAANQSAATTAVTSQPAAQLAIAHYKKAADYYSSETSPAGEAECLTRMAEMLADVGELTAAAKHFIELSSKAQSHELLCFGAKDLAFRGALCGTEAAAKMGWDQSSGDDELLAEAETACPALADSAQAALVRGAVGAVRASSPAAFDEAKRQFEELNTLDEFCERRLAAMRRMLTDEAKASLT